MTTVKRRDFDAENNATPYERKFPQSRMIIQLLCYLLPLPVLSTFPLPRSNYRSKKKFEF